MTWEEIGAKVAQVTSNGFLARLHTALLTAAVALVGWVLHTVSDHTSQLSGLTTSIHDLADAIRDHDQAQEASIGALVNVQSEQGREISALQQAERDREMREGVTPRGPRRD